MATPQIVAAKTLDAHQRLTAVQNELQSLLGVEFQPQPVTTKDSAVARYQQLDNVAGFMEAVTAAVKAKQSAPPPVVVEQPKPVVVTTPPPATQTTVKTAPKRK